LARLKAAAIQNGSRGEMLPANTKSWRF
jgi:hypothetical protein